MSHIVLVFPLYTVEQAHAMSELPCCDFILSLATQTSYLLPKVLNIN